MKMFVGPARVFPRASLWLSTGLNMTSSLSALAANIDCCLAKNYSGLQCIAAKIS